MPKEKTLQGQDELIHEPGTPSPKETAMSEEELSLLEEIRRMRVEQAELRREVVRLNAISDQTKGSQYDHENREKFFTGHLQYVSSPSNPIVSWKCIRNISYVDPRTDALVQDQEFQVTMKDGSFQSLDINQWNQLRGNQVKFKFLRRDDIHGICDIQLSTDGGKTFVGDKIEGLSLAFVNPL